MMAHGRANRLASYGRVANTETNPVQQIVMLYDGAIKFLRLAATDIENGDYHAKGEHSNRALDILIYLRSILDFEKGAEAARVLDTLYGSTISMTLRASADLDAAAMRTAADLLVPVRDAWAANAGASAEMAAAPAPVGTQQMQLNLVR